MEIIDLKINQDEEIFSSFYEINQQQVPKVGSVSLEEFINLIKISNISYGFIKKGICLGFVICLRENTNYKSINYKFFQNRHNKFFYIDRIAIANKYQSSGIGSILYKKLLSIKDLTQEFYKKEKIKTVVKQTKIIKGDLLEKPKDKMDEVNRSKEIQKKISNLQ